LPRLSLHALARRLAVVLLTFGLAACAWLGQSSSTAPSQPRPSGRSATPLLRLPPAALRRELSLQQRITLQYRTAQGEETQDIVTLLEADREHTRVAAMAGNQVMARLEWDGERLAVTRSPWAPQALVPERILSDLQLTLWPAPAIEAALPAGWRLDDAPGRRDLWQGDEKVVEVVYPDAANIVFTQLRDGYQLVIRDLAGGEGAP
jgi:hypothetical protein